MKIGFLTDVDGYRAPIHPESIEKYSLEVHLEKNIFDYLNYADSFLDNVKTMSNLSDLDIVACVENIQDKTIKELKEGAVLIGIFDFDKIEEIKSLRPDLKVLSFFKLPRISRAQNLDALSSQANIAGYKAVLIAASKLGVYMPLLMTAAGTIRPAKVLVLGAFLGPLFFI